MQEIGILHPGGKAIFIVFYKEKYNDIVYIKMIFYKLEKVYSGILSLPEMFKTRMY